MSQDYHDYEQLRHQHQLLAVAWQVGDKAYYVGLLGGLLVALAAPLTAVASRLKGAQVGPELWSPLGLGLFVGCLFLFWIGDTLKGYTRRAAGIH